MSTETRMLRPFTGGSVFQEILDRAVLIRPDGSTPDGERASVGLDDYLNYPFEVQLPEVSVASLDEAADELGLGLESIDLLAVVTAPRLRVSTIVHRERLGTLDTASCRIALTKPERPVAFRAPHGGADVRVCFCLNENRSAVPLKPWRLGTWLGMAEFRVRSSLSDTGFTPLKLTDLDRHRFGLPAGTSRYVTLDEAGPFEPDPPPGVLQVYVDEEILDRLSVGAGSAIGRQLQRQLFIDAVTAVTFAAHSRVHTGSDVGERHIDEFRGSLVHRVIALVAGRSSSDSGSRQEQFRTLIAEPMTFIARVEAAIGIRADILEALEEEG